MSKQARSQLLPLGAMAADLGVNPPDLRSEAELGRIPFVRVGKRGLLFDRELVRRLLAERAATYGRSEPSQNIDALLGAARHRPAGAP